MGTRAANGPDIHWCMDWPALHGPAAWLWLALAALYAAFIVWYGGRGRPLTAAEREALLQRLAQRVDGEDKAQQLAAVRTLVSDDDGREFVMHNLVCWRARAQYDRSGPLAHLDGGDAREADRRYGRLLAPELLKRGCVPIFIGLRAGRFIEPDGEPRWDYAALVRYRSRRDFLHFALAIERQGIVQHKWAAIEHTRIFPLRPMISLVAVRLIVAVALLMLGLAAHGLLRAGGWT